VNAVAAVTASSRSTVQAAARYSKQVPSAPTGADGPHAHLHPSNPWDVTIALASPLRNEGLCGIEAAAAARWGCGRWSVWSVWGVDWG